MLTKKQAQALIKYFDVTGCKRCSHNKRCNDYNYKTDKICGNCSIRDRDNFRISKHELKKINDIIENNKEEK